MDNNEEAKLDRLLSGEDRLSQPEKEELFEDIYAEVEESETTPDETGTASRVYWLAAAALLTAFASWALLTEPFTEQMTGKREFTARGGSAAPTMSFMCLEGGDKVSCREGAKLVFRVAPGSYSHFAAFAKSEDGPVIWYFPEEKSEESYKVANTQDGTLEKTVRLGQHHSPGTYKLWGIFSTEPLNRADIREAVRNEAETELKIVTKTLTIQ